MRPSVRSLFALLACAAGPLTAALGGERDVVDLFADLPVPFVVQTEEQAQQGRVFRLRSTEPITQSAGGGVYLRATVTIWSLAGGGRSPDGRDEAQEEIERRLASADPDTGLSYAWDYVAAGYGSVVHLHAGCTFSEKSFQKVAQALADKLSAPGATSAASFWCRCGGGCQAGAPFPTGPRTGIETETKAETETGRRLPPVRRPAGVEEGDYDNRLDPSGAWTNSIGELSLMHYANRLAFSYSAVFGPTAHICEGAGIAGLVGRDRYEYADEQGTVLFVLTETEAQTELDAGIASFCGAGWAGDRFTIDGFEPPVDCLVTAEHTHFHVVDTLDLERTFATVGQGNPVEVTPARHTGDEAWVLGRYVGPQTTRMGMLARGDIQCPPVKRRPKGDQTGTEGR